MFIDRNSFFISGDGQAGQFLTKRNNFEKWCEKREINYIYTFFLNEKTLIFAITVFVFVYLSRIRDMLIQWSKTDKETEIESVWVTCVQFYEPLIVRM